MEADFAGQQAKDSAQTSSDVFKRAEEAQAQASAELLAHLRQMLNEPSFSDVVFVCSDGKRVRALRKLLAGRSEVLKSMLLNGMAESALDEIEFPEISSPVLLSVFEFLYTGTLLEHHPQNLKMACGVIVASRFFLLPKLETITRKFIHTQTSVGATDLRNAASLLTEAMGFKALCDEVDVNLSGLVAVLDSNWSESLYFQNLSEDAFDYLLANSKLEDDGNHFSFREYLRFRQVIRWWVNQGDFGSEAAEELVNVIAPDEKKALCLCRDPDTVDRVAQDSFQLDEASHLSCAWSSFQLNKASRNSAIRLASKIDSRWIHPRLLAKVVLPLKIVSDAEIQNSFRFHALRRSMVFKTTECVWEHGESYSTREQGYVIHKTGNTVGFAVMTAAMSSSHADYHWRFVLEETCKTFFELGFMYHSGTGGAAERPKYDGARLSDQCNARVLRVQGNQAYVNWEGPSGHRLWKEVEIPGNMSFRVVFNYSPSNATCSLCINKKDAGIVWKNLPKGVYHPAVSLGESSQGSVSIQLVSGFDFL